VRERLQRSRARDLLEFPEQPLFFRGSKEGRRAVETGPRGRPEQRLITHRLAEAEVDDRLIISHDVPLRDEAQEIAPGLIGF